jgi:hypothetical protein
MQTQQTTPARPKLWARLQHAWAALMGSHTGGAHSPLNTYTEWVDTAPRQHRAAGTALKHTAQQQQPYNPQALPAAREQWQRGDWASLAAMSLDELQDHPDRAKLALLGAAGHMQMGSNALASDFARQAKAWGLNETLIRKTLVANVHAQLARCWEIAGDTASANANLAAAQHLVSLRGLKTRTIK